MSNYISNKNSLADRARFDKQAARSMLIEATLLKALPLVAAVPAQAAADLTLAADLSLVDDSSPNFPIATKHFDDATFVRDGPIGLFLKLIESALR
jgi:hypothetical protein